MLLARYIAEFSILYPAALLCYLPLSGFLRLRVKALCPLVLSVVTAFVLLGSAVCMRFQLKTNALLLPMMGAVYAAVCQIRQTAAAQSAVRLFHRFHADGVFHLADQLPLRADRAA